MLEYDSILHLVVVLLGKLNTLGNFIHENLVPGIVFFNLVLGKI
jgi:hypothetical protein